MHILKKLKKLFGCALQSKVALISIFAAFFPPPENREDKRGKQDKMQRADIWCQHTQQ